MFIGSPKHYLYNPASDVKMPITGADQTFAS
jgi:hypothetical protein